MDQDLEKSLGRTTAVAAAAGASAYAIGQGLALRSRLKQQDDYASRTPQHTHAIGPSAFLRIGPVEGAKHLADQFSDPTAVGRKPTSDQIKRKLWRASAFGREQAISLDAGGTVRANTTQNDPFDVHAPGVPLGGTHFHNHPVDGPPSKEDVAYATRRRDAHFVVVGHGERDGSLVEDVQHYDAHTKPEQWNKLSKHVAGEPLTDAEHDQRVKAARARWAAAGGAAIGAAAGAYGVKRAISRRRTSDFGTIRATLRPAMADANAVNAARAARHEAVRERVHRNLAPGSTPGSTERFLNRAISTQVSRMRRADGEVHQAEATHTRRYVAGADDAGRPVYVRAPVDEEADALLGGLRSSAAHHRATAEDLLMNGRPMRVVPVDAVDPYDVPAHEQPRRGRAVAQWEPLAHEKLTQLMEHLGLDAPEPPRRGRIGAPERGRRRMEGLDDGMLERARTLQDEAFQRTLEGLTPARQAQRIRQRQQQQEREAQRAQEAVQRRAQRGQQLPLENHRAQIEMVLDPDYGTELQGPFAPADDIRTTLRGVRSLDDVERLVRDVPADTRDAFLEAHLLPSFVMHRPLNRVPVAAHRNRGREAGERQIEGYPEAPARRRLSAELRGDVAQRAQTWHEAEDVRAQARVARARGAAATATIIPRRRFAVLGNRKVRFGLLSAGALAGGLAGGLGGYLAGRGLFGREKAEKLAKFDEGRHPRDAQGRFSEGDQVRVYRNLNRGALSVQSRVPGKGWRVAAHVPSVQLSDVDFRVGEAGRQRVLRTGRKNVHAYAIGRFSGPQQAGEMRPVRYDPYAGPDFVDQATGQAVRSSPYVEIDRSGIRAAEPGRGAAFPPPPHVPDDVPARNDAPRVTMLIGMPGSGKSTWRALRAAHGIVRPTTFISTDDQVEAIGRQFGLTFSQAFPLLDPKEVDRGHLIALRAAIARGHDIIVDKVNASPKSRAKLLRRIPAHYQRHAVVFHVDEDELVRRRAQRAGKLIPGHALGEMRAAWREPASGEFDHVHHVRQVTKAPEMASTRSQLAKAAGDEDVPSREELTARADRIEAAIAKRLAQMFGTWTDTVEDQLLNPDPSKGSIPEQMVGDLEHALEPLGEAIRAGAEEPVPMTRGGNNPVIAVSMLGRSPQVERFVQTYRKDRIAELAGEQRDVIKGQLIQAAREGASPQQMAQRIKNVVGLTATQASHVVNYQRELEDLQPNALNRALRDKRFDVTVTKAIDTQTPLSADQVQKMTDAYHRKYLAYRATTIARTEGVGAANNGHVAAVVTYLATAPGFDVEKTWMARVDSHTRHDHTELHGKTVVGMDTPFVCDSGDEIRWPHDPAAVARQTINCRCTLVTRLIPTPESQAPDSAQEQDENDE